MSLSHILSNTDTSVDFILNDIAGYLLTLKIILETTQKKIVRSTQKEFEKYLAMVHTNLYTYIHCINVNNSNKQS